MRATLLATVALLVAPAAAQAATITAVPRDRYEPAEVTMDPGERVTFSNRDITTHDVVGDGFRSPYTDPGRDSQVRGAETLGPGRYPFVCSLHSYMKGTLVVRGEPTTPPPSEPPPAGEPPPESPPRDTTAPRLRVRVRRRVARVTVDEAATIRLRARGRTFRRRTTGPATIRIRLPRRTRRVVVTATDAAGNSATVRR